MTHDAPLNPTHDPQRRSWLPAAGLPETDFPVQNLPLGIFVDGTERRPAVAIGDTLVDLRAADAAGLFEAEAAIAVRAASGSLNGLMALGPGPASALRARLSELLREGGDPALRTRAERLLRPLASVEMALPSEVGDYTDFLTSLHHTARHGKFKQLKDPVPPVFHALPVAYHGRASSIRVSGSAVQRPHGQWRDADGTLRFGPVETLDFELELAALIGRGNALGSPVLLDAAPDHIFGYALLNDWSAKSVQWWEQMLGPFLGKSFMTTLSPWVVTSEALLPFVAAAPLRAPDAPPLLPHLDSAHNRAAGGLDIALEAWLSTARMRDAGQPAQRISATHLANLSWTFGQMLAHHSSNGCNLRPGDVLGSGTVSGAADDSRACLTEITSAGRDALTLASGESRLWLHDGDEIELRARASAAGRVSIGFGPCSGRITAAIAWPGNEAGRA